MADTEKRSLSLKVDKFVRDTITAGTRQQGQANFEKAGSDFVRTQFRQLGGLVESYRVGQSEIRVIWVPDRYGPGPFDKIVPMLQQGQLAQAAVVMALLLSDDPDNADILYNLGMAYSDLDMLDRGLPALRHLLDLEPTHVNGRVALGVALMRQGHNDEAVTELRQAIADDASNPYAHRNLGGALLRLDRPAEAIEPLRKTTELNPTDERAWFGLAQALELTKDMEGADEAYRKGLDINEFGDVAENARRARSKIAQQAFRSAMPSMERLDAVMYLLDAFERFEQMSPAEVQKVGLEVAMLGTRGIDVNDPTQKFTLRSLPGQQLSGLHLVCLEYAAFKQIQPDMSIGFDLSKEYRSARSLYEQKSHRD